MLGIGTAEGAPITQEDGSFLKDEQGAILVPRLDEPGLKAFANDLDGATAMRDWTMTRPARPRPARRPTRLRNEGQTVRLDTWADQGYWLLLPLLLLAACAGRRGWLFACRCCWFRNPATPSSSRTCGCAPTSRACTLLKQKHPAEAAQHFEIISGKAWHSMKPAITLRAPPSVSPKATTPTPTTIVATPWPKAVSWRRRWMLTNRRWSASRICGRPLTNKALVESLLKQKASPPRAGQGQR
jgi:Ca-activated chloride channel family protein